MKDVKNKIAILEGEVLLDLIDELSYLRIMINKEIIPASKTTEVLDKINIDTIHTEVVKQVVKKFDSSIKDVNELSKISVEIQELVLMFHHKYDDIEKILNTYEKRVIHTKHFSRLLGSTFIVLSFGLGAMFYPALVYFSR